MQFGMSNCTIEPFMFSLYFYIYHVDGIIPKEDMDQLNMD